MGFSWILSVVLFIVLVPCRCFGSSCCCFAWVAFVPNVHPLKGSISARNMYLFCTWFCFGVSLVWFFSCSSAPVCLVSCFASARSSFSSSCLSLHLGVLFFLFERYIGGEQEAKRFVWCLSLCGLPSISSFFCCFLMVYLGWFDDIALLLLLERFWLLLFCWSSLFYSSFFSLLCLVLL